MFWVVFFFFFVFTSSVFRLLTSAAVYAVMSQFPSVRCWVDTPKASDVNAVRQSPHSSRSSSWLFLSPWVHVIRSWTGSAPCLLLEPRTQSSLSDILGGPHTHYISAPPISNWMDLIISGKHSLLSIFPPAEPEQTPFMHIPLLFYVSASQVTSTSSAFFMLGFLGITLKHLNGLRTSGNGNE